MGAEDPTGLPARPSGTALDSLGNDGREGGYDDEAPEPIYEPTPSPGRITIGAAEHVVVVGPSRSGKTHLCRALLRNIASRIIIDPKQQDFGPEWGYVTNDPEAILHYPQVVWQPDLRDVNHPDPKGQDPFTKGLRYIYEVRADVDAGREGRKATPAVVVYFDEAYLTAPAGDTINPWIPVLVASGMGRGIGVWASTQRGHRVYPSFFSDAIHVVSFRLQNQLDIAKLRNETAADPKAIKALGQYEFLYFRQGGAWSGPYQL